MPTRIWFAINSGYYNNDPSADPSTGVSGIPLNILEGETLYLTMQGNGDVIQTLNSGPRGFTRAIPAGYAPGWPTHTGGWATLDPATAQGAVVLSNGNLTMQNPSSAGLCQVTDGWVSGKCFAQITLGTTDIFNTDAGAGVGRLGVDISVWKTGRFSPTDPNGGALFVAGPIAISTDASVWALNTEIFANTFTYAAGDVLTIAVEISNVAPPPVTCSFGEIAIFPTLPIGFPVKVTPTMDTTVGTTKSLREVRVANQEFPLWDIEILFEGLKDQTQNETPYVPFVGQQQYEELVQLWLMMYGQSNVFAFDCPWDNSRENQQIAFGDGTSLTFTVIRTWGVDGTATFAPVGLINNVIGVEINGITVNPIDYSIDRNKITFTTPPANGAPITMTFSYYYLCRFVEDEQDFEEFGKNRWTVPSLKMRAVIWP